MREPKKISCIYFMFLRGKLIYVGKTTNLHQRMGDHAYYSSHDCLRWIECPANKLSEYEVRCIKLLKPLYNVIFNKENPNKTTPIYFQMPKWWGAKILLEMYEFFIKTGHPEYDKDELEHCCLMAKTECDFGRRKYGYSGTYLESTSYTPKNSVKAEYYNPFEHPWYGKFQADLNLYMQYM